MTAKSKPHPVQAFAEAPEVDRMKLHSIVSGSATELKIGTALGFSELFAFALRHLNEIIVAVSTIGDAIKMLVDLWNNTPKAAQQAAILSSCNRDQVI